MDKNQAGLKDQQTKARPKLSICIPTYNRASYLEKTLSNLVATAAFPFEWEIIISDNCSTDETADVAAKFAKLSDRVRYFRQPRNRGAEANIISAFRLAIGEFVLYLADGDALIQDAAVSVVRHLEDHPNMVACFSPWEFWNDAAKQSLGLSFRLEKESTFTKADSVDLFNFIIQRKVCPEIAIYQTDALHKVLYRLSQANWGFVILAGLLEWGDVAFLPYPFYQNVVFHWEGETRVHFTDTIGMNMDYYRGGVEHLLYMAFRNREHASVPVEQRDAARKMVNEFILVLLSMHLNLTTKKKYLDANEAFMRPMAYGVFPVAEVSRYGQFLAPRAAAQSLIETFEAMTWLECVGLYRVSDSKAVTTLFKEIRPDLPISVLSDGAINKIKDKDTILILVGGDPEREKLIEAGFRSGLVIVEGELVSQFML